MISPTPSRCTKFAWLFCAMLAWFAPVAWSQVVPLGTAANFGVLGASTVTNTELLACDSILTGTLDGLTLVPGVYSW